MLLYAGARSVGRAFRHRVSGAYELRKRVRPFRAGRFSLNLSGGFAVCGRRERAAPAAETTPYPRRWAKRKDNLRFSFLFELLPFPCFLIWRRFPICDRFEKGNGRGFFLCYGRTTFGVRPLEQPVRSVRYITATHTVKSAQAQHTRVAQLVSLEVTDGTYESIYLVAFILADPVHHNALKNRAALLCRALR